MKVLFKTIHGSRLYGLDHEDSDYDWFTVVDGRFKTHHKVDKDTGQDNTIVSFNTFVREAMSGAPKALEAMFSTKAEVDEIADFRASFKTGNRYTYEPYRSIMKKIALTPKYDDEKHKIMIFRLGINLGALRRDGRFNPTLGEEQVRGIRGAAQRYTMTECYDLARRLAQRTD